ncbi:GAF domain-containing protein [Oceanobacillus sp. J11TS1]|uniref:GAF domain-containing protein n=1 Tax=Oceanobacillus sp. J11TS1 TaxID=2807191 RepID=UPI001B020158|nr:GAF domain-containing protein [Oceanobacillus sp. J11TS1]GIO25384.1 hypothetical protein J11TS1_39650 [Oceanobacillus sp. J11TS1]
MSLGSKTFWSYVLSSIVSIFIIFSLASIGQIIYENITKKDITVWDTALLITAIVGITSATMVYSRYIRTSPQPIPLITINLNNFLYDKHFEDSFKSLDKKLIQKVEEHERYIVSLKSTLDSSIEEVKKKNQELEFEAYINDIYIRHHKNASRLVRSLLQLLAEDKPEWKWEFCNNVLDECVTVLEKDRSDKSSSVYFIKDGYKLEMYAYNRIEFWSSRNRKFEENEGFAGHVWSCKDTILINNISTSEFFKGKHKPKHEYGSILGVPIMIGDDVVGVLNIQSEEENGFTQEDERTVKFYADMCALAHFYDTINIQKIREGDLVDVN